MDWKIKAIAALTVFVLGILYLAGMNVEKELETAIAILLSILAGNEAHKEYKLKKLQEKAKR
ncbi:hypothetical protein [Candidatus Methanodesulfokora washburnensis]|jgi:hypothetical protein|uniref:Uncharacterized protein n=1 Tax=Candidatus Methanodesulfokora washburnensis TaxID=2478471 RepID=A0A429GWT7_9CREN|nr:hypothetical protein [Candidatus Methanodesulfokores washburnensis]RSN78421.1 hypothetical protein D6D85_00940 [Candidatus Methanodesulfokores washburnensis]